MSPYLSGGVETTFRRRRTSSPRANCALVVKDDVGRYAEKAGLYVLTQTDESGATLLNSVDFEPKAFS